MTKATLDAKAAFLTEAQQACRAARDSRQRRDLEAAAKLMDSPNFGMLPDDAQQDLHFAYAEAVQAVTGFGS